MAQPGYLKLTADTEAGKAVFAWWQGLEQARGDRAELRRCGNLTQVVLTPAYVGLRRELSRLGKVNDYALPAVAGLLAHVKNHLPDCSIATQMAQPKTTGGAARLSGLRFRRLLRAEDAEELFPLLIRVIQLLDGKVNLHSLADSVYHWGDRLWGDNIRREWAYDYYSQAPGEI